MGYNLLLCFNLVVYVQKFIYQDNVVTDDAKSDTEIQKCIEIVKAAFQKLNKVFKQGKLETKGAS